MAAADIVMTFAPFVDWGKFLPNTQTNVAKRAKAELPDGTQANVMTFPVNQSEVVIFPKTDDAVLNKEAFRMWQFIRLQKSLTVTRTMHLVVTHLDASTRQRIPVDMRK